MQRKHDGVILHLSSQKTKIVGFPEHIHMQGNPDNIRLSEHWKAFGKPDVHLSKLCVIG